MATKIYVSRCEKCRGTGKWHGTQNCFSCGGAGTKEFKSSPEKRAARNEANETRREQIAIANLGGFEINNPGIADWWNAPGAADFALDLRATVMRKGSLSFAQMHEAKYQSENTLSVSAVRSKRERITPDETYAAFFEAFKTATRNGVKSPSIRLWVDGRDFNFFPASYISLNSGYIYAKEGETYLGKLGEGRFKPALECSAGLAVLVLVAVADPLRFVAAHAAATGNCPLCVGKHGEGLHPECFAKFFPDSKAENA